VKKKLIYKSITGILLALMVFKVSSFHAYTHHDEAQDSTEHCAVCDAAIENEDVDVFLLPFNSNNLFVVFDYSDHREPITQQQVVSPFYLRNSFFGRPPPQ